ncbi:MAG: hypothetical protein KJ796_02985, partial [Alphaproteobacteria bacterium]|nr:hypothetical protein [Alphaproteobacteria bacterium]
SNARIKEQARQNEPGVGNTPSQAAHSCAHACIGQATISSACAMEKLMRKNSTAQSLVGRPFSAKTPKAR